MPAVTPREASPERYRHAQREQHGLGEELVGIDHHHGLKATAPRQAGLPARPGGTTTDLNMHQSTQTVQQGAKIIVRMVQIGLDGPTGDYFDASGLSPVILRGIRRVGLMVIRVSRY